MLLLATVLWGSAFAVMRVAAGHNVIFLLNGLRFLLGGLLIFLLPAARVKGAFTRQNLPYVAMAGLALFVATAFQQAGLAGTTAGNASFITSLYVVLVPVFMWIVWRERPSPLLGLAVVMAAAGGFLLSTAGSFSVKSGDLLILCSSFFWGLHVIVVGKARGKIAAIPFAFSQFIFTGVLNLITGAVLERPTLTEMSIVLPAILYTAVFSIAGGFTLQVLGQEHTPTSDAALILCLESVFGAFFGWLFLSEAFLPVQIIGCVLILAAVGMVQVKVYRSEPEVP
jgi:drug/metabolite transporter (DMT)-like permease